MYIVIQHGYIYSSTVDFDDLGIIKLEVGSVMTIK